MEFGNFFQSDFGGWDLGFGGGGDLWGGGAWGAGFTDPYGGIGAGGGVTSGSGFPLPQISIGFGGSGGGGSQVGGAPTLNQTLTQIVDQHEQALIANLSEFQNGAKPADGAISTGWSLMNSMVTGVARYGSQGQKAAAERDRRINPAQLRWDWIAYYIDPITGGPSTLPPLPSGTGLTSVGGAGGFGGLDQNTLLIVGALLLFLLFSKD